MAENEPSPPAKSEVKNQKKKSPKKEAPKKASTKPKGKATKKPAAKAPNGLSNYPRHSVERALRIPRAIIEQNAGRELTEADAAKFLGITNIKGPFQ